MTPPERELLTGFLQQMGQTQAGQKDPEADRLIRDAFARQPDAPYLTVQRAMALDYALQAAQAQAEQLQAELDQLRGGARSFLPASNAWGRSAAPSASVPAETQPGAVTQAPRGTAPSPGQAAPAAAATRPGSWGSGMLGNVAGAAAGVVAGSFLFQGLQGLMGHRDPAAGGGESKGEKGGEQAREDRHEDGGAPEESVDTALDEGGDLDTDDWA
jgi:hypothetical protein